MLRTIFAEVHGGKVKLLERIKLPEGTRVLVTVLQSSEGDDFWMNVSRDSLAAIWDHPKDDVYAELLAK